MAASKTALANARANRYKGLAETADKAKKTAIAAIKSEAGQTAALAVGAAVGGTILGYQAEKWLHDPERQFAADSIMVTGIAGIPLTSWVGGGVAAVALMRIFQRKGKLRTNAALGSLGGGAAGGAYLHKVSTEV